MSVYTPNWDKIINPLASTTTTIGGEWANLISDYFNGVNISLVHPTKKPKIGTPTLYKFETLQLLDNDESHKVSFSVDDIDTGVDRLIKIRRMNAPFTTDYMLFEGLPATIINKSMSGSLNTFTNIPKSALPTPTAYEDENNVFTTFQKIQYSATSALTLYRPDPTTSAGTGINFNMQNSTPTEISFAAIYAVNNANTPGSELGSLVFYIRNGASFVDRMALGSDNKLSIGLSGSRIVWDPTGISGGSKNFTMPNLSGEVQTLNAVQTQINKIIDTRTNTLLRLARTGAYYGASEEGVYATGHLQGLVGLGDQGVTTINTSGKYHIWNTKGVADDAAGVAKLDGFTTWRLSNPLTRFAFLFIANTSNNRRIFKGYGAQRLLSVDTDTIPLLNTEHGFVFGHGATDTQFQIWHNDGTGACVKVSTGVNLPGVNTNYILEIQANDGVNFAWTLYNVTGGARTTVAGTGTITTRIPGQQIGLYLQDLVASTTTAIQANNIHYIEVYN